MCEVEMTREQYEALVSFAETGIEEPAQKEAFLVLRKEIDRENGLKRYTLVIRYAPLPALGTGKYVKSIITLYRPPTRQDVAEVLSDQNYDPASLLVTADPTGSVGWCDLDHFPWEA